MRVLLTTFTLLALAWMIHLIIWKIRLPKHQIRALLLTFSAVFALWILTPAHGSTPLLDTLQISLF